MVLKSFLFYIQCSATRAFQLSPVLVSDLLLVYTQISPNTNLDGLCPVIVSNSEKDYLGAEHACTPPSPKIRLDNKSCHELTLN